MTAPPGARLNASIAPGGSIRVALLDPWERPLPGCEQPRAVTPFPSSPPHFGSTESRAPRAVHAKEQPARR